MVYSTKLNVLLTDHAELIERAINDSTFKAKIENETYSLSIYWAGSVLRTDIHPKVKFYEEGENNE